jgi:hypothetical protein
MRGPPSALASVVGVANLLHAIRLGGRQHARMGPDGMAHTACGVGEPSARWRGGPDIGLL